MRSRLRRRTGLGVLAVIGLLTAGTAPAHADIVVQAATCLANSTGSITMAQPEITWGDATTMSWQLNLSSYCLGLISTAQVVPASGPVMTMSGLSGSQSVSPIQSGQWALRLSLNVGGQRTVATTPVTVDPPVQQPLPPEQHTVTINADNPAQRLEFVQAIATPNTTVTINGDVDLNLSGLLNLPVAGGVQILGDRTANPRGPRIFTTTFPRTLLLIGNDGLGIQSDHVRISGIRLDGGQGTRSADSDTPDADGIGVESSTDVEIDHNEIYGFRGAGIAVRDRQNRISLANPSTVHIHDNYIHHNQHLTGEIIGGGHGAGYGVEMGYGAYSLIERNVFDYNRHAIMGDGKPGTGYLAYYNLILDHGGNNTAIFHTHQIDMHGTGCSGQCGGAGEYMDIEYNSVLYTVGTAVHLRGKASIGMTVANNVFSHSDVWTHNDITDAALHQNADDDGLTQWGNTFGVKFGKPSDYAPSCDFDHDGTPDTFMATGTSWWYRSTVLGSWVFLNATAKKKADIASVSMDGRCDVTTTDGVVYPGGV